MSIKYYDRKSALHIDGTPIFKSEKDEKSELEIAEIVSMAWKCDCRSFGRLSVIDWYFVRAERVVGIGELKTRYHESTRFETVFLNVRKWLALMMGSTGMGVPGIFVTRFTDRALWVNVNDVDASMFHVGGCKAYVKSRNDIEPVIDVPISIMKPL